MPPKDAAAAQGAWPGGGGGRSGDRLSVLPDDLLFLVIGHLKAWEAVRTCALSRRWRNLWASAGRLDIRQPCLCAGRGDLPVARLLKREEKFAAFVKALLLRRSLLAPPLESLRLYWSHDTAHGNADTWVAHAVRRGAVEIELSGKHHDTYPSPAYMSFIAGDSDVVKIRLKILKLVHVRLDGATLTQLCSRRTCLKEVELKDCSIPEETRIQSTLLEHLAMIRCKILKGLSVDAPNLVSLQFSRNFGYVPWIQNLGLLAASNVMQRAPQKYTAECTDLCSCNLKILKLSRVVLDDTTLAQLCSRCTSLEELELNACSVVGKKIRSTSLKCLTMISCKFAIGSEVHVPNLLSLHCTRPYQQVPRFQNMEFLLTAIIALDDSCIPSDSWWTLKEDDKDEYDHDSDFFAYFKVEDSDDNSDNEYNQDEEDESDSDFNEHSGAEDSDVNSDNESDLYEEDESDSDNESDLDEEDESDHSSAEESDGYSDVGNEKSDDNYDDESYLNDNTFMLCSLSNVRTMALSAHSGEVLLVRESKLCTDFKNLKTLSLGEWCITPDFDVLASILQRSLNLENLFVHLDMANNSRVGFDPRAGSFTCSNLKKVAITCCEHDKMDRILPELFGLNGITHEKISVQRTACTCDVNGDTGSQAKRKVQTEAEKRPAKQIKPGN